MQASQRKLTNQALDAVLTLLLTPPVRWWSQYALEETVTEDLGIGGAHVRRALHRLCESKMVLRTKRRERNYYRALTEEQRHRLRKLIADAVQEFEREAGMGIDGPGAVAGCSERPV